MGSHHRDHGGQRGGQGPHPCIREGTGEDDRQTHDSHIIVRWVA